MSVVYKCVACDFLSVLASVSHDLKCIGVYIVLLSLPGLCVPESIQTLHGGSGGMANTIPLRPPEPFDFKKPDGWVKWKRRFEQFLSASGLDKEDEARQVSTLLYCLGEEAEGVLASTNISEEARKKYKDVMEI